MDWTEVTSILNQCILLPGVSFTGWLNHQGQFAPWQPPWWQYHYRRKYCSQKSHRLAGGVHCWNNLYSIFQCRQSQPSAIYSNSCLPCLSLKPTLLRSSLHRPFLLRLTAPQISAKQTVLEMRGIPREAKTTESLCLSPVWFPQTSSAACP